MTGLDERVAQAWQAALRAEHQAVFGYGLLGPRLPNAQRQRAVTYAGEHEALRDTTEQSLDGAGLNPAAGAADYPSVYPVATAADALRLALRMEEECAAAWRFLYLQAAATHADRARVPVRAAQRALNASAVRAARWRATLTPARPTTPFPGT